jgi:sulfoxide reductase heme-binding subunit YedZ
MDRVNAFARRIPVWAVWALALVPLGLLILQVATNNLGPDPVKTLERDLGDWGIKFLILCLAVTPLRRFAGLNLIKFRRALGLITFTYVALHLMVWVSLDLAFRWAEIGNDLIKRPYIIVGMLGFILMIPLAVTSSNAAIRRLGGLNWRRLHKVTYAVAVLGALHFVMISKVWWGDALLHAAILLLLLVLRLPFPQRKASLA